MAAATITPSLAGIAAHFGDTPHAGMLTRLVLTLPALFIVLAAPWAGRACDRSGRKPVLLAGLALYVVAGSAGAVAPSLYVLLASRAVLGMGIACLMTATTTMIADSTRGREQARLLGLQGAFMAGGGVLFVFAGGLAAELHWRVAFGVYLLALLLLPAILRLPETRAKKALGDDTPARTSIWHLLREVGTIYLLAFSGMALFYLIPVYMPFLLSERFGATAGWVGAFVAFANLAAMVSGTQFGRVRAHLPALAMVALTAALLGSGYLVVAVSHSLLPFLLGLVIAGAGLGFMVPNLNHWAVQKTAVDQRGRALGGLTTAFFLGQFASPLLAQPVAGKWGNGPLYAAAGAVLCVGALLAALVVVRSRSRSARLRSTPPP